jgi:hypothetical protein
LRNNRKRGDNVNTKHTFTAAIAALAALAALNTATPNVYAAGPAQGDQPPVTQRKPRANRPLPLTRGVVKSAANGKLVIERRVVRAADPTPVQWTVLTTPQTSFVIAGKAVATFADIKPGDRVGILLDRAAGLGADNTATAKAITVLPPPARTRLVGSIKSVGAGSLQLDLLRVADVAIAIDADTRIIIAGKADAAIADLKAGERVEVFAERDADVLTADLLIVRPPSAANWLSGMIAAVNGDVVTVYTRRGDSVSMSLSQAVVWTRGEIASPAALKPGRPFNAIGIRDGATFRANVLISP